MSTEDTQDSVPSRPTLVTPRDATVVYGREATFAWEAQPSATAYRLQIAPTTRFEDLVVDEEVGDETAVTVGNQLPTDGQTFFWRVVAGNETGWGAASEIESFVAGSEDEAEQTLPRGAATDEEPVTELARASKRQVTRKVYDVQDRFEEEKERGVAYEGVAASQIIAISVAILVVISVASVIVFIWYGQVAQEIKASATDAQNYEQLRQAEEEAIQQLNGYGVVSEEEGVYHIPIDQAMDLVAEEESLNVQGGGATEQGAP